MQYQIIESQAGKSVSAVIDGRLRAANGDHPNYDDIVAGLKAGEDVSDLFDASEAVAKRFSALSERVTVSGGVIYLDGEPQDNSLTRQVVRFLRSGADFQPLIRFYEKLQANPVAHSREQLFAWLRDRDFSITEDGDFIAYKGLRSDLTSCNSGPGIVNGESVTGHLDNSPGNVVSIARSYVAVDPSTGCAQGLHAGTWEYASSFGQRVVEVRINPAQVVSVPTDCDAQKLRVCQYEVLDEVEGADTSALRYFDGDEWVDEDVDAFLDALDDDTEENDVLDVHYVQSDSDPSVAYEVTEYEDGTLVCECPSYQFGSRGYCKHTDRIA